MVLIFTLADTLQPMIIIDKHYYNVDKSMIGEINAKILAVDLPFRILFAPFYGTLADHFGRKALYYYAIVSLFLAFFTAPFHSEIFPGYLISRLLFINGGVCSLVLPFNADYVDNEYKGRAAGIAYTIGALGAVVSAFTLVILQKLSFSLGEIYQLIAFFILITGFINAIWIKGGNTYYREQI